MTYLFNLLNSSSKKSRKKNNQAYDNSYPKKSVNQNSFIYSREQYSVVKLNWGISAESHRQFLNRYMVQKNKDKVIFKPETFGNVTHDEYNKIRKETRTGWKKKISKHYKFVLSPEKQLSEKELKAYTFAFINKTEEVFGTKFNWQAAVHTDTEHNHVHVLINGVDQAGKKVHFPYKFVTETARKISNTILTQMYGEREPELIKKAKQRRIKAERWTEYDVMILAKISKSEDSSYAGVINEQEGELGDRLRFLSELGLAKYDQGVYKIKKNLEKELKALGRYNMYFDAKKYVNSPNKDFDLYQSKYGQVKGIVRKIYCMNDEDVWTNAIILETKEKAYYIPLSKPVSEKMINKEIIFTSSLNSKGKLEPKIKIVNGSEINTTKTKNYQHKYAADRHHIETER